MTNDPSNRFLWAFVAGLVFLGGLFAWSAIYKHVNTFAAGSAPAVTEDAAPPSLPPVRASDPRLGSKRPDAVELVEFADYRCVHCRAMAPDLLALLADERVNARLVWREAPTQDQTRAGLLPFAAARCAQAQGRFDKLHAALFQLPSLTEPAILDAARTLGLDIPRLQTCLADERLFASIRQDQATALANRISAAPTLFVRGQPYVGRLERSELEALLR